MSLNNNPKLKPKMFTNQPELDELDNIVIDLNNHETKVNEIYSRFYVNDPSTCDFDLYKSYISNFCKYYDSLICLVGKVSNQLNKLLKDINLDLDKRETESNTQTVDIKMIDLRQMAFTLNNASKQIEQINNTLKKCHFKINRLQQKFGRKNPCAQISIANLGVFDSKLNFQSTLVIGENLDRCERTVLKIMQQHPPIKEWHVFTNRGEWLKTSKYLHDLYYDDDDFEEKLDRLLIIQKAKFELYHNTLQESKIPYGNGIGIIIDRDNLDFDNKVLTTLIQDSRHYHVTLIICQSTAHNIPPLFRNKSKYWCLLDTDKTNSNVFYRNLIFPLIGYDRKIQDTFDHHTTLMDDDNVLIIENLQKTKYVSLFTLELPKSKMK